MVNQLLAIAAGGALGAVARYAVMANVGQWFGLTFPWGTLCVNVVGSFAMGAFVEASALIWSPSPELRALIAIGFLGSFTTFSTFSLDVYVLYERGAFSQAAAYVVASVLLSVAGLLAGLYVLRSLLAS